MLATIARNEISRNLLTFRFWFTTLLGLLLAAVVTWIGAEDYAQRLRRHDTRQAEIEESLRKVSVYSFLQPGVLRAPQPLSVLDRGFEGSFGTEIQINVYTIPVLEEARSRGNEILYPPKAVDLTTIVGVVLGLLALLVSCDAMPADPGRGDLPLLLAHPLRSSTVLAGKVLGGVGTVLISLAVILLPSLAIAHSHAGFDPAPGLALRLLGIVASYVAYVALMVLVGTNLSLYSRGASAALAAAILFWIVAVLVLPLAAGATAADLGSAEIHGVAARERIKALEARFRERMDDLLWSDPVRGSERAHFASVQEVRSGGAILRRFGSRAYYDSMARYQAREIAAGIATADRIHAVRADQNTRLRARADLYGLLAAPSPAHHLDRLCEIFAGTALADLELFLEAARRYRHELIAYLEAEDAFRSWRWFTDDDPDDLHPWPSFLGLEPDEVLPGEVAALFNRLREPAALERKRPYLEPRRYLDLSGLPRFTDDPPSASVLLARAGPHLLGLLALFLVLATSAWVRFHRLTP